MRACGPLRRPALVSHVCAARPCPDPPLGWTRGIAFRPRTPPNCFFQHRRRLDRRTRRSSLLLVSSCRVVARARGSSALRRCGGLKPLNAHERARSRCPCFCWYATPCREAAGLAGRAPGCVSRAWRAPPDPSCEPGARQPRPRRPPGPPDRCARRWLTACGDPIRRPSRWRHAAPRPPDSLR